MPRTVLLVDDDPHILSSLQRILHGEPYRFLTAPDAATAIDLMHLNQVDVVLSDDQMPGITGIDFFAQLRHLFPGSVRIILTGNLDPARLLQAVNEGNVFRFLLKPCPKEVLAEALRQAIDHKFLLDQGGDAIHVIRRQAQIIRHLQTLRPADIASAVKAAAGIRISDQDFDLASDLAQEISLEVRQFTDLFPALERNRHKDADPST